MQCPWPLVSAEKERWYPGWQRRLHKASPLSVLLAQSPLQVMATAGHTRRLTPSGVGFTLSLKREVSGLRIPCLLAPSQLPLKAAHHCFSPQPPVPWEFTPRVVVEEDLSFSLETLERQFVSA